MYDVHIDTNSVNLNFEVYSNVLICLYKSSRQCFCCMDEV